MYNLTLTCFICLKSKRNLCTINKEILTQLIFCIGKIEEFILPTSNEKKICEDCLNKLNTAFDFKKTCLNNIVQIRNYKVQLNELEEELINNNGNKLEKASEVKNVGSLKNEQILEEQSRSPFKKESCGNNESQACLFIKPIKTAKVSNKDIEPQKPFLEQENAFEIKIENSSDVIKFDTKEILNENCGNREFPKEELLSKDELNTESEESLDQDNPQYSESNSCTICGKSYKYNKYLKSHMLRHNGPHTCPTCGKSFTAERNLQRHLIIHKQSAYSCLTCGKYFKVHQYLKKHMQVHSDERLHSCATCGKYFKNSSTLRIHVSTHTNERPYSCSICEKSFALRKYLIQHMFIHGE